MVCYWVFVVRGPPFALRTSHLALRTFTDRIPLFLEFFFFTGIQNEINSSLVLRNSYFSK